MATNRIEALTALLTETERAHGVYESTELNGEYDQDWPQWYASYAVEHGIGGIVGRDITAGQLAALLTSSYTDYEGAGPEPSEPWATYAARRIIETPNGAQGS